MIVSSPAVANGVVYIGSGDGAVYAVDQKNGQQKWKAQTRGPVASSPAVAEGMVFFLSYDGGFYCLDAGTGARKWRYATGYERRFEAKRLHGSIPSEQTVPDAHDVFLSSPAVINGRVYFGSSDHVYWYKNFSLGAIVSSPVIDQGEVYFGSTDGNLYALY